MTASTLVMMLFSCPSSRERTSGEHNPARAHSIVCRRPTEIETIYRSYQDLLCKTAIQAYPVSRTEPRTEQIHGRLLYTYFPETSATMNLAGKSPSTRAFWCGGTNRNTRPLPVHSRCKSASLK